MVWNCWRYSNDRRYCKRSYNVRKTNSLSRSIHGKVCAKVVSHSRQKKVIPLLFFKQIGVNPIFYDDVILKCNGTRCIGKHAKLVQGIVAPFYDIKGVILDEWVSDGQTVKPLLAQIDSFHLEL